MLNLFVVVLVAQLCPTLCNPMDCSLPGSSVHGILQARILERVAISFSMGSSWPRDWTPVPCIGRWILYHLSQQGSLSLFRYSIMAHQHKALWHGKTIFPIRPGSGSFVYCQHLSIAGSSYPRQLLAAGRFSLCPQGASSSAEEARHRDRKMRSCKGMAQMCPWFCYFWTGLALGSRPGR